MLPSTTSKSSRRSTRVGRQRASGGFGRQSSRDEASWRLLDKSTPARKWIQVMRPPSPSARFYIPTWVTVDDLTPEERSKYNSTMREENPESGNTEMAQENAEEEEEAKESYRSDAVLAIKADDDDDVKEESSPPPPPTTTTATPLMFADGVPENSKEIIMEDSTTEGLSRLSSPGLPPDVVLAAASVTVTVVPFSKKQMAISDPRRPHDPVAATIADPGTVPPSRPVSEPSTILMTGQAAPLIGDLVASPVAVTASPSAATPVPMDLAEAAFVHSASFDTPFHTPNNAPTVAYTNVDELETELQAPSEPAMLKMPESADDSISEPETKRPRME